MRLYATQHDHCNSIQLESPLLPAQDQRHDVERSYGLTRNTYQIYLNSQATLRQIESRWILLLEGCCRRFSVLCHRFSKERNSRKRFQPRSLKPALPAFEML